MKKLLVAIVVLCLLTTSALAWGASKSDLYNDACNLLSDGSYAEAAAEFAELGEYQDASLLNMYCSSLESAKNGQFALALSGFQALGDFRDSKMQALYYAAIAYENLEQYEDAQELLLQIPFFKDSNSRILTYPEKINARDYAKADKAEQNNQLETALKGFTALGNYSDSKARAEAVQEKICACDYAAAESAEEKGNLEKALEGFLALKNYSDSAERAEAVREKIRARDYDAADQAEKDGDYATALTGFTALGDYKDSKVRALAVKDKGTYAQALQYALDGKFDNSYELFASLGEYKDSVEKAYTLGVCKFAEVTNKGNGIAAFKFHDKYGIINVNTNTTVSPFWDEIGTFDQNGLAKVAVNEKYGYVDTNGNTIIACDWADISDFSDGLCTVAQKSGKNYLFGIYDTSGKEISGPQWRTLASSKNSNWDGSYNSCYTYSPVINEEKIKVQNSEGLWGFINIKGEIIGEIRWENIEGFSENAAVITENKKYGFLNNDGTVLIEPQYTEAYSFSGGLAAVKTNGKWGYIDHTNSFVITPYYGQVASFKDGYADVYLNGTGWQIIDNTGALQYFINEKTISDYNAAITYYENQEYSKAYAIFSRLVGYKDSNELAAKANEAMKASGEDAGGDVIAEEYSPSLIARIGFADQSFTVSDWESSVVMNKSGTYAITANIPETAKGVWYIGISITNEDSESADSSYMLDRSIRIDEILVNGEPIAFDKNYTVVQTGVNSSTNKDYFNLWSPIYCEWEIGEGPIYAWDGDNTSPAVIIINPSDFDSVDSLSIKFTYGIFR